MKRRVRILVLFCCVLLASHGGPPPKVPAGASPEIYDMLLRDDAEAMRKKLERGLSPNALWSDDFEFRDFPILCLAFSSKAERVVRLMFEKGASPFLVDPLGQMPIQWAHQSGRSNLVECVRSRLPEPEELDMDGLTNRIQNVLSPNWKGDHCPTPVDKVIWTDRPLPDFRPPAWTAEELRKSDFVVLVVQTNGMSIPFCYEAVGNGTKKAWGASLVRRDGFLVMEGPWSADY